MRLRQSGLRTRRANQPKITPPITSFSYCFVLIVTALSLTLEKLALAYSPLELGSLLQCPAIRSNAGMANRRGGRRLALRASLRPQLALCLAGSVIEAYGYNGRTGPAIAHEKCVSAVPIDFFWHFTGFCVLYSIRVLYSCVHIKLYMKCILPTKTGGSEVI